MNVTRHEMARAFGAVLKIARHARGISQERLAHYADIDRVYPSLLERGLRQPTLTYIFAIAHALDMDPGELVRRTQVQLRL